MKKEKILYCINCEIKTKHRERRDSLYECLKCKNMVRNEGI